MFVFHVASMTMILNLRMMYIFPNWSYVTNMAWSFRKIFDTKISIFDFLDRLILKIYPCFSNANRENAVITQALLLKYEKLTSNYTR